MGRPQARPQVSVDIGLLKNLVEMGFSEQRGKRALGYFRNNLELAIEHMMNHEESQDDDILGPV